jgi:hypothetical protein
MRYPNQASLTIIITCLLFRTVRFLGSKNQQPLKKSFLFCNLALMISKIQNAREHNRLCIPVSFKIFLSLVSFCALANVVQSQTLTTNDFGPVSYCPGTSFFVNYSITGPFNAGNEFRVQLSDASGNFIDGNNSSNIIGLVNSTSAVQITATLSDTQAAGTGYRVRVVSTNPVVNVTNASDDDNGVNITVLNRIITPTYPNPIGPYSPGQSISISFTVNCNFIGGNFYTLQLSDPITGGSVTWTMPTTIATLTSPTSGTISGTFPTVPLGYYAMRIVSSSPASVTSIASNPFLVVHCPMAATDTLYVNATNGSPGDGSNWAKAYTKLQDALLHACNCPDTDFDIWVAQGTYYPDEGVGRTDNNRDETFVFCDGIKLYGGFTGTETMLSQRNWTTNVTILSGDIDNTPADITGNAHHVVVAAAFPDVIPAPTTHLDGFTITGGNANANGVVTVNINGQTVQQNFGGGIYTFRGNNTMTNNTISGNSASDVGGGIVIAHGTNTITNNTIYGNSSSDVGGGIVTVLGNNTMTNNTISGNSASFDGGGIFIAQGTNTMTNNTISGNSAGTGGGIFTNSSTNTMTNNTISGNSAGTGGGIFTFEGTNTMTNSIIWGNNTGIFNNNSTLTVSYSIVQGGFTPCTMCPNTNGDISPMFIDSLPPSMAPTTGGNYRLQSTSPAINAGNNAGIPMGITTDITGGPRILQGTVDLGAYEQLKCPTATSDTLYVNASNMTPGDGSTWSNAYIKLQDALLAACGCPNTDFDIWVAQGTYYPDEGVGRINNNRDETFVLCDGIKLYGGFSGTGTETMVSQRNITGNPTILSGDLMDNDGLNFTNNGDNSYHVVVAAFADATPTTHLDGFTITGGNANGSGSPVVNGITVFRGYGGGIYISGGNNTLTNNSIINNSASNSGGGVIVFRKGILNITFCELTRNRSDNTGGGLQTLWTNSIISTSIRNSIISDNVSLFGAGIHNQGSTLEMINSVVSGNIASGSDPTGGAGGLENVASGNNTVSTLTNCTFSGNQQTSVANPTADDIYSGNFGFQSIVNLKNTIINGSAFTSTPNARVYNNGTIVSQGNNLDSDGSSGFTNGINNDLVNVNPSFISTTNLRLQPTSPAINAGDNSAPGLTGITTDITGGPRILQGTVDLGAYETITFTNDPSINDPCRCRNNATTAQNNGQFDETIEVNSGPGETWTVTAVSGLFSPMSAVPPAAPTPIMIGATLTETNPGVSGVYRLDGIHVDNIGYSITVENGSGTSLSLSNRCAYPNVTIDQKGPFFNQAGQPNVPLTLTVEAPSIGTSTWSMGAGIIGSNFNPSGLAPGAYPVSVVFDADSISNKAVGMTPGYPGCIQPAGPMNIMIMASTPVCRGRINYSIDANGMCQTTFNAANFGNGGYLYIRNVQGLYLQSNGTFNTSRINLHGVTVTGMKDLLSLPGKTKEYTFEVSIGPDAGANKCWGIVIFEDKALPVLTNLPNDTVFCWNINGFLAQKGLYNAEAKVLSLTSNGTMAVNVPTVTENCGIEAVTVTDVLTTPSDCNPVYTRTWKVTDCGGNTATISHTLMLVQPNWAATTPAGARLILPVDDTLTCGASVLPVCPTLNGDGVPVQTGGTYNSQAPGPHLPAMRVDNIMTPATGDSLDVCITLDPKLCGYFANYTDQIVDACALNCHGNRKIFRTWTILDWCNNNLITHIQVIKRLDTEAPTAIAKDTTVSTRPWDCTADVFVPELWELYDNCDLKPTYTLASADPWVRTALVGGRWRASGLRLGANTLQWVLRDCCGNQRIVEQRITVLDRTAPVPVAKQDIVLSLTPSYDDNGTPDAQAKLYTASVDNGSFDNCTEIRREIRRPLGGDCGNATFTTQSPRHNSNRTFRNNWIVNPATTYAGQTGAANAAWANSPAFGQNALWNWTNADGSGARTVAGSLDRSATRRLFSINEKEGTWIWQLASNLSTFSTSLIGRDPDGSVLTNYRANDASLYNALDEDGGEFVKFCCEDITTAGADWNRDGTNDVGYHEVIMRVWDDGNADGCIGCWVLPTANNPNPIQDNYNDTWANVKVENKVPPVLTCPPAITVSCEAPITTSGTAWSPATASALSFTGMPTAWSACGTPEVEYRDVVGLNQCKTGTIVRTFRIVGTTWTCNQLITVSSQTLNQQQWTFNGRNKDAATSTTDIPWPAVTGAMIPTCGRNEVPGNNALDTVYYASGGALSTTNCEGPTRAEMEAKAPFYIQGPCDVIGINIDSERFDFEEGQCRKWVVTYTYMNWCDNKCVTFKRDWVFRDTQAPVVECAKRPVFPVDRNCTTPITLSKSATDAGGCPVNTTAASTWLKWEVFVDVNANGTWDYAYSSFRTPITSNNTTWIAVSYGEFTQVVPTKYLAPTAPGANATIDFRFPVTGKESDHKVLWRVYDGCHNATQCLEEINVRDNKPPTPYCIHLSTALMQVPAGSAAGTQPMVEVWAKDFNINSEDNCTAKEDLKFTFDNWKPLTENEGSAHYFDAAGVRSEVGSAAADTRYMNGELQRWIPSMKSSAKVFTKKDLPGVTLKMSVIDWNGQVDFCSVDLRLVCNDPVNCAQAGSRIAGTVSTESNQGVNNVTVTIDAHPEYPVSVTTPTSGAFEKRCTKWCRL